MTAAMLFLAPASFADATTCHLQNVAAFADSATATGFVSTNVGDYISDYHKVNTTRAIVGWHKRVWH
jgi:hypothetical protein